MNETAPGKIRVSKQHLEELLLEAIEDNTIRSGSMVVTICTKPLIKQILTIIEGVVCLDWSD